ncbi:MAG: efflux RND transporter permease subunit [Elusimicrobia bacterium]|nr:efflux RND transporter permease subunit [Elusimicrobiota bacterium]
MNLSEIWIRRPVMTVLVMVSILFFGLVSYKLLPISDLPTVDFPIIVVNASLPGASPEVMASSVATPLEKQFSSIAGLDAMSSKNMQGSTQIVLQFSLDRDADAAAMDVNTAIAAAQGFLPTNLPTPPTYLKVNPADQPVIYFALASDTLPISTVNEYAETTVSRYLSALSGVGQVNIYGSKKFAVRIQVNPATLTGRNIALSEVADAIRGGNVNLPSGQIDGLQQSYTLEIPGQLFKAEEYGNLIVKYQNGYPVRVKDLGQALDDVQTNKSTAWFVKGGKSQDAVIVAVTRQPGTNTVKVVQEIREAFPKIRQLIPASVGIYEVFDQSRFIEESIKDVQLTLLLTITLVIFVVFLFIREFRPTIIPSVTIPLALVATFAVMKVLGFSLNNLSMMALVLSVGFVVDDAIVMLENVIRHMELGEDGMTATLQGSKEIGFTIISMTLSLVVVFVPLLFMGGLVGRLFREFAVSIAAAILVSGFLSITLTPMMCSVMLKGMGKGEKKKEPNRLFRLVEQGLLAMNGGYARTLKLALGRKSLSLWLTVGVLAGTGILFKVLPKGFIPSQDQDYFTVYTQADDKTSFAQMVGYQKKVNAILAPDPDLMDLISVAGMNPMNTGFVFAGFKPSSERKRSIDQILASYRAPLNAVPGLMAFLNNPPPITVGGKSTNAQWQYVLQSSNLDDLYRVTPVMVDKMRAVPGLTDVSSDLQLRRPKLRIHVDRDKASSLGVSLQALQDTFYSAFGSRYVSTIYGESNEYYVILELDPQFMQDPAAIGRIYLRSKTGDLVPLSTISRIEATVSPVAVNHQGQIPAATISFNLKPGTSIGQAMAAVKKLEAEILPSTISTDFSGSAKEFSKSMSTLGFLMVVTIFIIYVVLGVLYENYWHPVTILSALPLAGFGALFSLWVFRMELDMYAFVGVIMLVGLVKKNGIMMVDTALELQRGKNLPPEEAIYEACKERFRPIMMTTLAALLGTLPIALGFGAGGESRMPMGVAVVGGLFFSQFLTLYVTPVFFLYFDRIARWTSGSKPA